MPMSGFPGGPAGAGGPSARRIPLSSRAAWSTLGPPKRVFRGPMTLAPILTGGGVSVRGRKLRIAYGSMLKGKVASGSLGVTSLSGYGFGPFGTPPFGG